MALARRNEEAWPHGCLGRIWNACRCTPVIPTAPEDPQRKYGHTTQDCGVSRTGNAQAPATPNWNLVLKSSCIIAQACHTCSHIQTHTLSLTLLPHAQKTVLTQLPCTPARGFVMPPLYRAAYVVKRNYLLIIYIAVPQGSDRAGVAMRNAKRCNHVNIIAHTELSSLVGWRLMTRWCKQLDSICMLC